MRDNNHQLNNCNDETPKGTNNNRKKDNPKSMIKSPQDRWHNNPTDFVVVATLEEALETKHQNAEKWAKCLLDLKEKI